MGGRYQRISLCGRDCWISSFMGSVRRLDLQHGVQDQYIWKLSVSGYYTYKSAYRACFLWTQAALLGSPSTLLFDMLDATMPLERQLHVVLERDIFGWVALNALACEGEDCVERGETYKQLLVRNRQAGLRQSRGMRSMLEWWGTWSRTNTTRILSSRMVSNGCYSVEEGPHPLSPFNVGGRWCSLWLLLFHNETCTDMDINTRYSYDWCYYVEMYIHDPVDLNWWHISFWLQVGSHCIYSQFDVFPVIWFIGACRQGRR